MTVRFTYKNRTITSKGDRAQIGLNHGGNVVEFFLASMTLQWSSWHASLSTAYSFVTRYYLAWSHFVRRMFTLA